MPDKILSGVKKLEYLATPGSLTGADALYNEAKWASAIDMGEPQGDVTVSFTSEKDEVVSDYSPYPIHTEVIKAGATVKGSLIKWSMATLQKMLSGTTVAAGTDNGAGFTLAKKSALATCAFRITFRDALGADLYVIFPKASFSLMTDLSTADRSKPIPFELTVLDPGSGDVVGVFEKKA